MDDLFESPTVNELTDEYLTGIAAEDPSIRRGPGSLTFVEAGAVAVIVGGNHAHMDVLERSVTPLDADESGLIRWGAALELPRKGGIQAGALQALQFTSSTPATAIPLGTALVSDQGLLYEMTAAAIVGGDGVALVDVVATDPGQASNLGAGERLSLDVPIVGLAATGTLIRDLVGGADEESLGAWQARQVEVWRNKQQGGNRTDYEQLVLTRDWAERAFVYPMKPTISSVGIVALRGGGNPIPTVAQIAELQGVLDAFAPVPDEPFVLTVSARRVDVDDVVALKPGSVADWTEPVGGLSVSAYDPVTQTVTTVEDLPSNFESGDLSTIVEAFPSTAGTGIPVRTSAVTGVKTFVIAPITDDVGVPIPWTIVGGERIYPSSIELSATRTTIIEGASICDSSGNESSRIDGVESYGPANPGRIHGDWESDYIEANLVTLSNLSSAVNSSTVTIQSDGTAAEFPWPNDTAVELLTVGQLVVRV
jgi:uncharacterized phage protein gp47/JayE